MRSASSARSDLRRNSHHIAREIQRWRTGRALLQVPGAAAALCRLGQRNCAAPDPDPWRARPLPQLGCDRAGNCSRISMSWLRICAGTAIPNGRKEAATSLSDNVYDLARLMRFAEVQDAAIVGHSMGGMVALAYAGTYPDRVSRLVVLDGAFLSGSQPAPIAEQMSRWIDTLHRIIGPNPGRKFHPLPGRTGQ